MWVVWCEAIDNIFDVIDQPFYFLVGGLTIVVARNIHGCAGDKGIWKSAVIRFIS